MDIGVIDLFCGVGGISYGFKQAGIIPRLGVDTDKACEYPYTFNNEAPYRWPFFAEPP